MRKGRSTASAGRYGRITFITHSPQPHLDGRYSIVGRVIDGMQAVRALQWDDRFDVGVVQLKVPIFDHGAVASSSLNACRRRPASFIGNNTLLYCMQQRVEAHPGFVYRATTLCFTVCGSVSRGNPGFANIRPQHRFTVCSTVSAGTAHRHVDRRQRLPVIRLFRSAVPDRGSAKARISVGEPGAAGLSRRAPASASAPIGLPCATGLQDQTGPQVFRQTARVPAISAFRQRHEQRPPFVHAVLRKLKQPSSSTNGSG
jgi:hypothetical protein